MACPASLPVRQFARRQRFSVLPAWARTYGGTAPVGAATPPPCAARLSLGPCRPETSAQDRTVSPALGVGLCLFSGAPPGISLPLSCAPGLWALFSRTYPAESPSQKPEREPCRPWTAPDDFRGLENPPFRTLRLVLGGVATPPGATSHVGRSEAPDSPDLARPSARLLPWRSGLPRLSAVVDQVAGRTVTRSAGDRSAITSRRSASGRSASRSAITASRASAPPCGSVGSVAVSVAS